MLFFSKGEGKDRGPKMDVSATKLDAKMLDSIVKRTVEAIEESKSEIYDVYEAACGEVEKLRRDLLRLKEEAATTIDRVDKLEIKEKQARINLMEVSKCFRQFSEEDVRKAYDMARDLQVELAVARECELNLRLRRDEMELRLRTLELTAHKAQRLVSQVGAVLGYLGTQMDDVVVHIESLQQTQRLGAQIIHAQEEERRRVAREIHDGPAQTMANLVFRTEICERMVDRDSQRAKAELADLREQVRGCLREVRKIICDLRPMSLDDLGLVATLKGRCQSCREQSGTEAQLRVIGKEVSMDAYRETAVFRIVQEALHNVEKHAKAKQVQVVMEYRPKTLQVLIQDDGIGFSLDEKISDECFGLLGMRERANILKGDLRVQSEPGAGTQLFLKIPLEETDELE